MNAQQPTPAPIYITVTADTEPATLPWDRMTLAHRYEALLQAVRAHNLPVRDFAQAKIEEGLRFTRALHMSEPDETLRRSAEHFLSIETRSQRPSTIYAARDLRQQVESVLRDRARGALQG